MNFNKSKGSKNENVKNIVNNNILSTNPNNALNNLTNTNKPICPINKQSVFNLQNSKHSSEQPTSIKHKQVNSQIINNNSKSSINNNNSTNTNNSKLNNFFSALNETNKIQEIQISKLIGKRDQETKEVEKSNQLNNVSSKTNHYYNNFNAEKYKQNKNSNNEIFF